MRQLRTFGSFNWIAVGALVLIIAVSLLAQRNADFYTDKDFYDRQVVWMLVGLAFFFVPAILVDLRIVERLSYPLLVLCVVLLVATMFFGTEVNNSKRWLRWGINVQASELTKLAVILSLARFFHNRRERIPGEEPPTEGPNTMQDLLLPLGMVLVPVAFILVQPDLGTSLLIVLVSLVMTLYEGVHRTTVIAALAVGLLAVPIVWKYGGIQDYQKERVVGWIDPDWLKVDPETGIKHSARPVQSEQAVWAISSGEFWGQGSQGGSKQRLRTLPEIQTDMIIAPFAEEQGFFGCTVLLLLFWILVAWALRTAKDSRDRFCELVAVGIAAMIGLQVFINVGMVTGLLPIVGLPLPFLSYGGSALLTTLASIGLVLNIALRRGRL